MIVILFSEKKNKEDGYELFLFWHRIESEGKGVMKPLDLLNHLMSVNGKKNGVNVASSALVEVLSCSQEAVIVPPRLALAVRPRPGVWEYLSLNLKTRKVAELTVPEYLQLKENVVDER